MKAAIDKARAQRDTVPYRATRVNTRDLRRGTVGSAPQVDAAWGALAEIQLDTTSYPQNRVVTHSGAPASATFDLMRTRLLQQARQHGWRRIGIVSPHSGCGQTTLLANLLFSLARQKDTRSLIFDFDLRRRGLSKLLHQNPDQELSHVLEGGAQFGDLARRHGGNVAAAFNRSPMESAAELLQSPQTGALLNTVQVTYQPDIMLFDLPPLMGADDSLGFLERLDCALLVAAAGETTVTQIDMAERQVSDMTNVMGIVLNKCREGHLSHENT